MGAIRSPVCNAAVAEGELQVLGEQEQTAHQGEHHHRHSPMATEKRRDEKKESSSIGWVERRSQSTKQVRTMPPPSVR